MTSPARSILMGLLLLLLAGAAWTFWPSDRRSVEHHYRDLLSLLNKARGESLAAGAARNLDAVAYLDTEVMLRLGEPFPSALNKSEARSLLQQARMRASRITIQNRGYQIERTGPDTFTMEVTVEAQVEAMGDEEEWLGTYTLTWRRIEGAWKLAAAERLDIIQHPAPDPYSF